MLIEIASLNSEHIYIVVCFLSLPLFLCYLAVSLQWSCQHEQLEARKIKVQGSLNFGAVVWVELNASVLDHIACCMRTSYKEEHGKKVVVGDGVRWSAERRCYIARRATKKMKTFRVDQDASDQELADNDAKVKARAWAQGNDLSSDDCDEDESGDDED